MRFTDPLSTLPETGLGIPIPGLGFFPITWGHLAWAAIVTVPLAIILLYFLKLKRQPLEVPSTYLWHKSIEDLHVNSIWQRLRTSLLLLLQILLVALVIVSLFGLAWRGEELPGDRHIFLIDTSASMSATDVQPSRLAEAKRQVAELIDRMESGDSAMLVTFSNTARVEQAFTHDRKLLRQRLEAVQPTQRTTDLLEALRVASGLANPGRVATDAGDVPVADALPATLYILSDGKFPDVHGFRFGNLTPEFVPIGTAEAGNVGILALSTRRREDDATKLQAFARLQNFSAQEVTVQAELYLKSGAEPEVLADASEVKLAPEQDGGVTFDLDELDAGMLRLKIVPDDALPVDNQAWTAINEPRPVRVLCVTPGNDFLRLALVTGRAKRLAEVTFETPEYLAGEDFRKLAPGGMWDLCIFDRCRPPDQPEPLVPLANTLFIGAVPAWNGWAADPEQGVPVIIDSDKSHPLMQLIEMGDVLIYKGTPLRPPPGATVLLDSNVGTLLAIAPRGPHEDAVLGFELMGEKDGQTYVGTSWVAKLGFPMFVMNVISYLGGQQSATGAGSTQPGQLVTLSADLTGDQVTVVGPDQQSHPVRRERSGEFRFTETERTGPYDVRVGSDVAERFAVNLFDSRESDIRPRVEFQAGAGTTVAGTATAAANQVTRREVWKWLLLAALAVLLFEWYIYNRRVYI
jgi:hypothetical protein